MQPIMIAKMHRLFFSYSPLLQCITDFMHEDKRHTAHRGTTVDGASRHPQASPAEQVSLDRQVSPPGTVRHL